MTQINEVSSGRPENGCSSLADHQLAQMAGAGDIEAFEEIYWRHHRRVFGICLRMIKNVTESEDMTQEIFIKLFLKIGSFRGEAAFTTWLHRMTVNQILMYFRKNKTIKEQTTENGELPETGPARKKKSDAEQIADRILLNQVIADLPDGYRKAIMLHDIHGFDHQEIGQILGCAVGTSKSQLHKARRKLRRLLSAESDNSNRQWPEAVMNNL